MSETFDTLTAARLLKEAGMERPHAEAVTDIVRDSRTGLATQAGVDALRHATEAGMDALRREIKAGMDGLNDRINAQGKVIDTLRWVVGLNLAMTMAILVVMLTNALQP